MNFQLVLININVGCLDLCAATLPHDRIRASWLLNGIKRSWIYLVLILNFITLPPLLSFILYFCFHHSIRHYIHSIYHDNLIPRKYDTRQYLKTIIMTSVFFAIIVLICLQAYGQYSFDIIIVKYIFILLACLTLPHLILNIYYDTHKIKS